jgi:hypothetical protein
MLFRAFVRALLWTLLGVVLVAVSAYLAIDLGLADWVFGHGPEAWLNGKKDLLQETLNVKGESIDRSLKIAGFAFTLIFGALGLLNLFYHAEDNLPDRMVALNERIKKMHLEDRVVLLAPYRSRNLKGDQTPAPSRGILRRVLGFFTADPYKRSLKRLANGAETLDEDISVLSTNLEKCKTQRITTHLLEGSKLAVEAKLLEPGSTAQQEKDQAALAEFEKALKLDENDLDALEYAAKQAKLLNSRTTMLRYLLTMERAAQDKRPALRARAARYQAEYIEEHSPKKAALKEARKQLEDALADLDVREDKEKPLELALLNEQLGSFHLNRGTLTLVKPYLDAAEELYQNLPPPEHPAGVARIEKLRARLARAQQGDDS